MKISLDPSVLIPPIYHRKNRAGSLKLIFKNANETAYSIAAIDFDFYIKSWDGLTVQKLSVGSGLTKGGVDNNELVMAVSELLKFDVQSYFCELFNKNIKKTWINTDFIVHDGKYDASENQDQEIVISSAEGNITIVVSDNSTVPDGLILDRGNYDASTNLYPASGGSGGAGAAGIKRGNLWTLGPGGILDGEFRAAGTTVRALENNPGQDPTKWNLKS